MDSGSLHTSGKKSPNNRTTVSTWKDYIEVRSPTKNILAIDLEWVDLTYQSCKEARLCIELFSGISNAPP